MISLLLWGIGFSWAAPPCDEDIHLNGHCIKKSDYKVECEKQFASKDSLLQRACLQMGGLHQNKASNKASSNATNDKRYREFAESELSEWFPDAASQLKGAQAIQACRQVIENYRSHGVTVDEAPLARKFKDLNARLVEIERQAEEGYLICSEGQKKRPDFGGPAEEDLNSIRAISVEALLDGTLYPLRSYISQRKKDQKPIPEKCVTLENNLSALAEETREFNSAFVAYYLVDYNTSADVSGQVYSGTPGPAGFLGVRSQDSSKVGAAFFRTYVDCKWILELYEVSGFKWTIPGGTHPSSGAAPAS